MALAALEAVGTPEQFGAVGDGRADDTEAILGWIRVPAAVKAAPPGRIYRITRALDLSEAGFFDLDFGGSIIKLAHTEPLRGDGLTVYGLHLPARHALRNVTIEGLGGQAMQSGAITPPGRGCDHLGECLVPRPPAPGLPCPDRQLHRARRGPGH